MDSEATPSSCTHQYDQMAGLDQKGMIGFMGNLEWVEFKSLGDQRGELVALEIGEERNIPFEIRRIYYIYRTADSVSRGFHAHRNLQQVAIAVSGSCDMVLDNGSVRETVNLNDPTRGLVIRSLTWREMHNFSTDCVLLVLASEHYDESDYIRSYEEFLKEIRSNES